MVSDLIALAPFTTKMPPRSVVLAVPPAPVPRMPASVLAKVKVPLLLVIVVEAVSPLKAVDEVAKVTAPVSVTPGIAREETPLLMEEVATHCGSPLFQASTCPPMPVPKRVEDAVCAKLVPAELVYKI